VVKGAATGSRNTSCGQKVVKGAATGSRNTSCGQTVVKGEKWPTGGQLLAISVHHMNGVRISNPIHRRSMTGDISPNGGEKLVKYRESPVVKSGQIQ
jgi:hypothetical protein